MTEGRERAAASYWPPLSIDGDAIDLGHLEPFRMTCEIRKLDRSLTIDVRFSNHCFTDHFENGIHDPARMIMDGKVERVFSHTRYRLSAQLPHMVRSLALSTTSVWQTRQERNYVHFIEIEDQAGDRYPMFFTLKKAQPRGAQLAMMIESAYPVPSGAMREILRISNKVAFPILCAKVFQNQPLRFNARR